MFSMIFFNLIFVILLLLICAIFAGDIHTFINIDSIVIVLLGFIFSSLAVSVGRYKLLLQGFTQIFKFSAVNNKNNEIKNMFTAISIMTIAVGICSTVQGLISSALIATQGYQLSQVISYASFTIVYSVILVCLLLVPIIFLNKES